jgi:16S rRNA processing protein RimM
VVRFAEINDRDVVKALTNQLWFEPRDKFPDLADDEIYFADLIGLVVKTADGNVVGPVKDVLDIGPSDILVIDRDGREVMVPNVEAMVKSMDLEKGEIIITPPAGLIDDPE